LKMESNTKILLGVVLAILVLVVLLQTWQLSALNSIVAGASSTNAASNVAVQQITSGGMVGGC